MLKENLLESRRAFQIMTILIGALAGHFLLHPFSDLVTRIVVRHHMFDWQLVESTIVRALGLREFSLAYSLLGAFLGYFYARTVGMQREKILQLERFSRIGMNASAIIHDLGNPLTGISWFAELLERKSTQVENKNYARMIKKSAEEISKMMLDIKTLAIDPAKLTLNRVCTDVCALAERMASTMQLNCEIAFASPEIVYATLDPAYFERVFWNLFKNADEAMGGKSDARITVSISKEETGVTICVDDNGPGIRPELEKKLLNFGETYGKKGGSGIGLYNCKKIVETHGGRLWFTSKTGKGASFFIHLPE